MTNEEVVKLLENADRYVGIHYVNGVEDTYMSTCLKDAIGFAISFIKDHSGGRKCDHNATEMRPSFISDHSGGANKMVDHVAYVGNMAPLTIEQMRDMGGKPYWHVGLREDSKPPHWAIMDPMIAKNIDDYFYGERWIAYAYPPAHIDLEAWTAEWVDNDESEEMMCKCSKCGYPVSYFWGKTGFCPGCGKAMTPEALAMLEKRLRGNVDGKG